MTETRNRRFPVAFTADLLDTDGKPRFADIGLSVLTSLTGVEAVPMREFFPIVRPEQLQGVYGAIVMDAGIDVQACTAADIVFFNAVGGVERSMAEATVGWMIALSHHFRAKDLLVRNGQWSLAPRYVGLELRDRTFGSVGFGGIARATVELLKGFGMSQPIAFDPFVDPSVAERRGVRMVSLEELMQQADFVSIHCPLNAKTRNLVGQRELALMKSTAFLINTARGGIVNEDDLFAALGGNRIAGAALDVFVGEPFDKPHRFGELDNVLLAPHAVGLTHEILRDMGRVSCKGIVDIASGRRPNHVINPEVFDSPAFQQKWKRLQL
jgi:phosphoglycerate dehydrogenase-like enzyme